jgi:FKBP-type peptidyl-prolyl cis-trans isomerase
MNISLLLLTILGVWSSSSSLFVVVVNASNEAGIEFLTENKNKDGIITLDSGLQYKILNKGKGLDHPTIDSSCTCHYEGKLLDDTIFDSSYERNSPSSFAPNQVIKGWTEAMQLMVAGDKVRTVVMGFFNVVFLKLCRWVLNWG